MQTADARRAFASDNNAGVHPAVLAAIADANAGHVAGYGDDPYTERATAAIRRLVGDDAQVFFAFNGTGANVIALAAALRPHQAVICPQFAHLNVDEGGAFERFAGAKLIDVPVHHGKLTPDDVERQMHGIGDPHHVQPAAISISQSTEVGTVYAISELGALGDVARKHGLLFHVDGARIANAAAALGGDLRAMLVETGVDVFTFGGTKNGLLFGEAVVFTRPHPAAALLPFVRKQGMQLASKMRFVAAQFEALLADGLWLENAAHANRMARRLAAHLARIRGVRLAYSVDANGVFVQVPRAAIAPLQVSRRFYVWDDEASVVRWMCSFDTTEDDVDDFAAAIDREVRPLSR
ncbi:threonine aldolase [Vulcanimicrobium alpinum]|uniref:Threonine aldolase n=1 Tax=Vulcanimicrobium alpinum TaxID=3016050 RepID=A0AAN2C9Y5_UNVUL|nr:aminotransferase class I/II-fold pyridoxal phosphate-dependent enzyme [Vulcanimicrobium alpinum]BDE07050.1 threonine aldolase [Vulcanimicrobium alpinum]